MTFNKNEYMKEYYLKNKEHKKEWDKEYYLRNKERRLQCAREWRSRNKEKLKTGQHKYYLKNSRKKSYFMKECYFITRIPLKNLKNYYENDYRRNYCIKNKEHIQERHREWYLKNRESILHHQKIYRDNR